MTDHAPSLLLVDDDQVFRERTARVFARRGLDVRTAGNYDEAMASARADSPEMAVVDLNMPGRSGLEVLRDLKALDPTTRVVMLTGYGSIPTALDAMRLGATWYVAKPAGVDEILGAFQRGEEPPLVQPDFEADPPSLARVEWEHMNRVLSDCGGNISEAARRLKMHRRTLQRKLQKYPPRE